MKIYITNDETTTEGYTTFSPLNGDNIRELDSERVADSECSDILCPNIIDYIPFQIILPVVQNYIKKLRRGGNITIGGTDLYLASLLVTKRDIPLDKINELIFGGYQAYQAKSGLVGVNDMLALLEGLGLKIVSKSLIDGYKYLIVGRKN